jgi:hydrogenase/urease accessory protein HupE
VADARLILLLCLSLLCGDLRAAGSHPDSVSSTRITVAGDRLELRIRTELRTWHEAAAVDADLSGTLEQGELAAALQKLAAYVGAHLELQPVRDGERLAAAVLEPQHVEEVQRPRGSYPVYELALIAALPLSCNGLFLNSSLFELENPLHRDQCTVQWGSLPPVTRLVWAEDPSFLFHADGVETSSLFGGYLRSGVEHILLGYDHLAFVLVLLVASRRLRQLGWVSLAFTLSHSLTLAASTCGWVSVPSRPVEVVIALTVAWVALWNLRERERRLWPEALGFGLVHGFGFAGAIGGTLAAEPEKLTALLGFNLGVELGQLAALGAGLLLLRLLGRSWFATARVRIAVSGLVAVLALYWAFSRVLEA